MTPLPPSEVRSTCPYCGVGCGVVIETQGGRITGVRGDTDHPANRGRLCTKGQSLHLTASPQVTLHRRLLHPMHRPRRGDTPQRLGWDAALELTAQGLARTVQRHGADAVGVYVSGQLLTEDYYLFNKFTKGLLGTNHIDSNSRLCMSSAVVGYKLTLGADAPPACYDDIQHADCLWVAGSNAAWAHPVLFRQVEDARRARPHMKMVVVDPRRTATAEMADLHLALQPGTDVLLCQGLLHIMRQQGWLNPHYIQQHTEGWDALQPSLDAATPEAVSALCGVAVPDLFTAAQWFAGSNATLSLYCQGLNQSVNGSANNAALIHLHLATGHMGRPGAGPFSLTGQPNAMGGREVGAMATLMSGHRTLSDAADREELAALWGVPSVPSAPGRTAMELFEAAADGQVKALWVACTNPAQSLPHQSMVKRALERAEFVVVQEAFAHAATLAHADVLLPAAPWGEKDGTVTNSERCISRVRAAVPPSGESRPDWRIVRDVAQRVAVALGRPEAAAGFAHTSPEAVWNEHRATTAGRDLDITGLSYGHLDNVGPAPWPFPRGAHAGRQRLRLSHPAPALSGRACRHWRYCRLQARPSHRCPRRPGCRRKAR